MRFRGELIGAVESILVRALIVGFDPVDQVKLPDHAAPDRRQPAVGPEIKTILIIRARARGAKYMFSAGNPSLSNNESAAWRLLFVFCFLFDLGCLVLVLCGCRPGSLPGQRSEERSVGTGCVWSRRT